MMLNDSDLVFWESGNRNGKTSKIGYVVQVVDAGKTPDLSDFSMHDFAFGGTEPRECRSYLVEVVDGTRLRLYWPRAANLELVLPAYQPQAA